MIHFALLLPLLTPQISTAPQSSADAETILVELTPRVPFGADSLRWSPKGAKLQLRLEGSQLRGQLRLGPKPQATWAIALGKSDSAEHFDRLWIDSDHDFKQGPEEWLVCTPSENRSKFWSSFSTVLQFPAQPGQPLRPYSLNLWFVEDPLEPNAAPALRWSRSGWHQGEVKMDDQALHLLICESRMDGFFDEADAWHLGEGGEGLARQAKSRSLGKHAWLGEAAYRMVELDPNGHWIRIQAFDPGITRKEEELQEDVYRADRMAKRAPAPLAFSHNFEEALAEAKSKGVPLLLDFETTWCGPCKLMDQLVYGALDVVNAATKHRIVAVKVDGDERRDLVEQYKVEGYPTILLIAPDGTLTRRVIGYQSVAEMTNFIDS